MLVLLTYSDVIRGDLLSDPAKCPAVGDLYPEETLQGNRRSAMGMHIHPLYDRCLM